MPEHSEAADCYEAILKQCDTEEILEFAVHLYVYLQGISIHLGNKKGYTTLEMKDMLKDAFFRDVNIRYENSIKDFVKKRGAKSGQAN